MQTNQYNIPVPFFNPDDPEFNLSYDPKQFHIKTEHNDVVAEIAICCKDYRNTHKYGMLFSMSPDLFRGCKKALNSQRTIIYLLDKVMPDWKRNYNFDITYRYLKKLLEVFENDVI